MPARPYVPGERQRRGRAWAIHTVCMRCLIQTLREIEKDRDRSNERTQLGTDILVGPWGKEIREEQEWNK